MKFMSRDSQIVLNKFIDCKQKHAQAKCWWLEEKSLTPELDGAVWEAAQTLLLHKCHRSSLGYINRAAPVSPQEPEGSSNKKMTVAFGSHLFLKKPQYIILSMEDAPTLKEKCPVLVEFT